MIFFLVLSRSFPFRKLLANFSLLFIGLKTHMYSINNFKICSIFCCQRSMPVVTMASALS